MKIEENRMEANEELTRLMKERDLTIRQVADLIEVSPESVKNWLRQHRSSPMPKVALLALRLSIELKRI